MLSGIFNSDDDKEEPSASSGEESDEILAELKKKQAELRALSHQNTIMLRHLHKQAKEELQSQELKKKMAAADAEVDGQDREIYDFRHFICRFYVMFHMYWRPVFLVVGTIEMSL